MPPWNQMTPQQQQMLLQMMHAQFGGGAPQMQPMMQPMQSPTMAQQMMQPGGQPGINPMAQPMQNPLLNQQNNIMQNPQMLQYLMQMRGAQAPGLGQFTAPPAAQYTQVPGW